MEQGWIRLYRSLLDCPHIRPGWELGLWVTILLKADWEESPGELVATWVDLSEWSGLDDPTGLNTRRIVRKTIDKWVAEGMLEVADLEPGRGRKRSVLRVKVVNWHAYQNPVQLRSSYGPATVQQSALQVADIAGEQKTPVQLRSSYGPATVQQRVDSLYIHPARACGSPLKKERNNTLAPSVPDSATPSPPASESTPSAKASAKTDYPPASKIAGDYPEEFEQAWKAYPKRPGNPKRAAYKAWRSRVVTDRVPPNDLLAAATEYAKERQGEDPAYTQHASTFFGGGGHWEPRLERARSALEARETPRPIPAHGEEAARPYRASDALTAEEREKLRSAIATAKAKMGVDTLSQEVYNEASAFIRAHLRSPETDHFIEWSERYDLP